MCASFGPSKSSQVLSQAHLSCFGIAMPTDAQWKREAERLWDTYRIVMLADRSVGPPGWGSLGWKEWVYVLGCDRFHFSRPGPLQCIDYFHGKVCGYVMAQMSDEENVRAKEMISLGGWVERAVTDIQRRFRTRVRATQMMNGRLLPDPLCGFQHIARSVASYMPYEKASLQSRM